MRVEEKVKKPLYDIVGIRITVQGDGGNSLGLLEQVIGTSEFRLL
jgi:hypothetical protein